MPQDALADRLRKLQISETDLQESFARSSVPGGQNVNKVSTAVTLRHLPAGMMRHRPGFAFASSKSLLLVMLCSFSHSRDGYAVRFWCRALRSLPADPP